MPLSCTPLKLPTGAQLAPPEVASTVAPSGPSLSPKQWSPLQRTASRNGSESFEAGHIVQPPPPSLVEKKTDGHFVGTWAPHCSPPETAA